MSKCILFWTLEMQLSDSKELLKGFNTCAEVAQYTLEQETMEG
jgi:hypothetical protein